MFFRWAGTIARGQALREMTLAARTAVQMLEFGGCASLKKPLGQNIATPQESMRTESKQEGKKLTQRRTHSVADR